jgi:hypothetical protein
MRLAPLSFARFEQTHVASTTAVPVVAVSRKNAVVARIRGGNALPGKGQIGRPALFDPLGQQLLRQGLKQGRKPVQMQAAGAAAASSPQPGVPA